MNKSVLLDAWHVEARETRKERGLTQQEIASMTGIYQSRISQIENGEVDPKLSEVISLTQSLELALVLSPHKFLDDVEYTIKECLMIENRENLPRTIPQAILGDRY